MRRTRSRLLGVFVLTLSMLLTALPAAASNQDTHSNRRPNHPAASEFVEQRGSNLYLQGHKFRFIGSNNYYPMYNSTFMTDSLLEDASAAGFTVLRAWGSYDIGIPGDLSTTVHSGGEQNGVYLHYWDAAAGAPAVHEGPDGIDRLDYLVWKAGEEGVKLVFPLVNNWADFGGMDQYVSWADNFTDEEVGYHADFYTNDLIKTWFKDWFDYLANHVNPLTGLAYKDDPTIMMWELGNEPRCKGNLNSTEAVPGDKRYPFRQADCDSPDKITAWADEMSTYIKSVDSNHLVASGTEGFLCEYQNTPENEGIDWPYRCTDGVDELAISKLANVDMMSLHAYPTHWGFDSAWTEQWIEDHLKLARHKAHKPAYVGEFGWDEENRNGVFKDWLDVVIKNRGAGALYWILSSEQDDGSLYPDYDGFTVYCPSPVCTTVSNAGILMQNYWALRRLVPVADHDVAETEFEVPVVLDVTSNDIAYGRNASVVDSTVDLDLVTEGIQAESVMDAGVFTSVGDGTVLFTPATGFDGKVEIQYTVRDRWRKVSNPANITVFVNPLPGAPIQIVDFSDGSIGGFVNVDWDGSGDATLTSADGKLTVVPVGGDSWIEATLPTPIDISDGYVSLTFDLEQPAQWTYVKFAIKVGPDWSWCESSGGSYSEVTPAINSIEISLLTDMSCDLSDAALASEVHAFLIYVAGEVTFSNIYFK